MRNVVKYWISVSVLSPILLHATQSGFKVVSGDVSVPVHEGNACTIHSRTDAIIQWDSFSIDSDKLVRFTQKSSDGAVLNRIVGSEQTALMGQLLSNGKVYVLNPNGVLIGPNAQIVASSFLASTLDVLDEEFLKLKEMRFFGPGEGAIVNLGTIKCPGGDIILLAKSVSNQGTLLAEGGFSGIGIGTEILIRPEGTQRIYIRTGEIADATREGCALENSGAIKALATELRAGSNPYAKAIRCSGEIDATIVKESGGQIYLVAEKGLIEVDKGVLIANTDSGTGGTIQVLGDAINVLGGNLDVSGRDGGGEILIGGDFQGKNPAIANAKQIFISKDTTLLADAIDSGNGGKIIAWSDLATGFHGKAFARGGATSGDGGIVEASGHLLDFRGHSDTTAMYGKTGTLFLDPSDITISAAADSNYTFALNAPICNAVNTDYLSITAPGPVVVNNLTLNTQLATNCVVLSTDAAGNGLGAGIITVNDAVSWGAGNPATTLTLQAAQNIVLNAAISCTSTNIASGINLIASGLPGLNASPVDVIGINQAVGAPISTNAGNIFIQGVAISQSVGMPGVQVNGAITSTTGTVTFQNCIGGNVLSNNYGVQITSTGQVNATTILANNITGGRGSGNDYGFYVQGTLGTASTTTLTIAATSIGTSANEVGIYVDSGGKIQIGDTGTLQLAGTGSLEATAALFNHGIFFDPNATLAIGSTTGAKANLTGVGGGPNFGGHRGVDFRGILQMAGESTLNFVNCHGGSGSTGSNFGVSFAPNATSTYGTTPTISFNHCAGGSSSVVGNNIGVRVSGVTIPLASNATVAFFDVAGGLSANSANIGVSCAGLTVNTGSITLQNITGGGASGSTLNTGVTVEFGSSLIAPTITATDIMGGPGTGSNYGFQVVGTVGATTSIAISAGSLGVGGNEYGIFVDNGGTIQIADVGNLELTGTGTSSVNGLGINIGIFFDPNATLTIGSVTGATANLNGIGGTGAIGSNFGVAFNGILNMAGTSTLNFTNCYGGRGGGNNRGVVFGPNPTSSYGTAPTISFNHCAGGLGNGNNIGVMVSGVTTSLASNATFTFFDITGGTFGLGNRGVVFSGLTVNTGSITLQDITGGGIQPLANLNSGVIVETGTTLTAPTILANNIIGGRGTGNDYGFHVQGTVGTASTITLTITATSTGTSANAVGIYVDSGGKIQIGDGGILQLIGTGSLGLNSASLNNNGIFFDPNATLAIGSTTGAVASLTGIGGGPNFGGHTGVDFNGILQMAGVSTLNFVNCHGGSGDGGSHFGVSFAPNVASIYGTTPTISFNHCAGGSSTFLGDNVGVRVSGVTTPPASNATFTFFDIAGGIAPLSGNNGATFSGLIVNTGSITLKDVTGGGAFATPSNTGVTIANGTILTAPTIIANDITGGPGADNNFGFYIPGGTLGSASTISITISASSLGNGSFETGIFVDSGGIIQIADTGTLQLTGMGSMAASGLESHGIFFSSTGTLAVGSATGAKATLTGVGGTGSNGSNYGVDFEGILSMVGTSSIDFINCYGGIGNNGDNIGVSFAPNAISAYGTDPTISFRHCAGGISSFRGFNIGVSVTDVTTPLSSNATFNFFDIAGGGPSPGNSNNEGVSFSGLTVNAGVISLIDIVGGGSDTANSNRGIVINDGTTLTAPTISATGIVGGLGNIGDHGIHINGTLGTLSNPATTHLIIQASGDLSTDSSTTVSMGIFIDTNATVNISDNGRLTFLGQGGGSPDPSFVGPGIFNSGIEAALGSAIVIGSGGGEATAIFSGVGGNGNAGNDGVRLFGTVTMNGTSKLIFNDCSGGTGDGGGHQGVFFGPATLNAIAGPNPISFINCHGGSGSGGNNVGVIMQNPILNNGSFNFINVAGGAGGNNNYGVSTLASLQVTAGSIVFNNVSGGHGASLGSGTNNHGVFIPTGLALNAPEITGTSVLGGAGSGNNIGWYMNGSTCAASTAIAISSGSMGVGAGEVGLQVDNGGVVQTTGGGTITITGFGGRGTGTTGYGIYVTGANSAITSVNGAISMTGVTNAPNIAGIQVDTTATLNATGSGALTLATPAPQPIALGSSTISTNSGNLTFDGKVNAIAATPAISSASGTITFNEPFILTATPPTIVATAGSIVFNNTIDGAFNFSLTAGTSITFAGALGNTTPLTSLTVTAPNIVVNANQTVNSSIAHSYIGAVTTTAPVTFTELGSAILSFSSTITGNFPLTLLTSNSIAPVFVGGAINTSGSAAGASGGSLVVAAGGNVTFTGAINTSGSLVAASQGGSGGDVTVHSLGSIITTDITVSGGAGTTIGGNSGTIFLQPNSTSSTNATFGVVPNGTIEFNGAVITASGGSGPTIGNSGDIILAPLGRSVAMSVATMFTNPLALDSLTITGGNLIMGAHEALTVFDNATFTLTGYSALGDVVVLNNFSLTSGTVIISPSNYLIPRAAQLLLKNDGTFYISATPHILSGGTFSISGGLTPSGFNEGNPSAGITLAQLTFMGVPLNLDEPAMPTPSAPSNTLREKQIRRLSVADVELNDLALTFVDPRAFWPYWSRMCCCTDKKSFYELPHWTSNYLTGKKRKRPRCSEHPEIDCHEKRVIQFTPFLHRSDNI